MSNHQVLQDSFLAALHKDKIAVSVFLVSGIKLHGMIDGYDENVIMLKNGITQMIYKHAISTVVPSRMVATPAGE